MSDLLRDAPVGQLIRWVTKRKVLKYHEEVPGFDCPTIYQVGEKPVSRVNTPGPAWPDTDLETRVAKPLPILKRVATVEDVEHPHSGETVDSKGRTLSRIVTRHSMSKVNTRQELEQAYMNSTQEQSLRRQRSQSIAPQKMVDGTILVDWYTTDDPENPQNWSSKKKLLVVMQIYIYTLAVYMGSAI
jgi:DHA1 family multidrug resistance protein-like MFS transporter